MFLASCMSKYDLERWLESLAHNSVNVFLGLTAIIRALNLQGHLNSIVILMKPETTLQASKCLELVLVTYRFCIQWSSKTHATMSSSRHPGPALKPTLSKEPLKSTVSAVYQWDDFMTQECWLNVIFLQKNIIPSTYLLRATNSL